MDKDKKVVTEVEDKKSNYSLAGFIMGWIALIFSFSFGGLIGIVGLFISIKGCRKENEKAFAIVGIVLNSLSIIINIVVLIKLVIKLLFFVLIAVVILIAIPVIVISIIAIVQALTGDIEYPADINIPTEYISEEGILTEFVEDKLKEGITYTDPKTNISITFQGESLDDFTVTDNISDFEVDGKEFLENYKKSIEEGVNIEEYRRQRRQELFDKISPKKLVEGLKKNPEDTAKLLADFYNEIGIETNESDMQDLIELLNN